MASALGGELDGVLAEEANLKEAGLVKVPDHLRFAEAATLPCAGLTPWLALVAVGRLTAGHTVLPLGNGGVYIFDLHVATPKGPGTTLTSSSAATLTTAPQPGTGQRTSGA